MNDDLVRGDGIDEFVVGARRLPGPHGHALLVSGVDRKILVELTGDQESDGFGTSVAETGDIDGDGVADILIGSPDYTRVTPGRAILCSGATGAWLRTFSGENPKDSFGWSVAGGGDVNGDGYPDQVVGQILAMRGYAHLYSGKSGSLLYRFELPPSATRDQFGCASASVGDMNGDGLAEIAIGASAHNSYTGSVTVYLGNDLYLLAHPRSAPAGTIITITCRELHPGDPVLLAATAIDGAPGFLPLLIGFADSTGTFGFAGIVPSELTGHSLTMRAFAMLGGQRLIDSAAETASFP